MDATGGSRLAQDKILIFIPEDPHEGWIEKIQSRFPGFQIRWHKSISPEGTMTKFEDLPEEVWDGLTMYSGFPPAPANYLAKVRFVQLTSAGADKWAQHESYLNSAVMFCNSSGIHP